MAKRAVEHVFTGLTTPYASYDSTKTTIGKLIQQQTGVTDAEKYIGPMPISLARPMEASTAIAVAYPHVHQFSSTIDWVFLAENSTAAATRRVIFYEFNKTTRVFTWKGFVTLTFPTATTHTIRGFRVLRELYTTGTASASGTAVTGSGTAWNTSRLSVGSRIGFGSTDPSQIGTWYEISAVGSDTSITLTADAGTVAGGAYVIEELMIVVSTTNATVTNGGLFVVKGLNHETFSTSGTVIPAATTTDRIRAVYWLADAATVTNTVACGVATENRASWTEHNVYVIDGTTTTCKVYKYNVRAALTLTAGKATDAYILKTAAQTPTGTVSQNNNGRIGILSHGPGSGAECLYFVTTTRVYRASLSNITNNNATWQSDAMVEVPPGGSTTYHLTGVLSAVEIADTIDRLIVTSTGSAGARSYVTQYNTISDPFDHIFLNDDKQYDQYMTDSDAVAHPAISAFPMSVWSEGGIGYFCRNSTVVATMQVYAIPIAAHWTYAGLPSNNQRVITPELSTSNAVKYTRLYVNADRFLGSGTFGVPTEPFRAFYRTSGITDDSGEWQEIDETGDLNGISAASSIQFMFEFKILGMTCIPARIHSLVLVYEDNTTDSHYQPSVAQSSASGKVFAWRFSTAFGGTVPALRIRLYNAATGGLLLDDTTTASASGTWEKSTNDGSAWGAYDTTDKGNETTYIRYTPTTLGDNIKVRALLTQN